MSSTPRDPGLPGRRPGARWGRGLVVGLLAVTAPSCALLLPPDELLPEPLAASTRSAPRGPLEAGAAAVDITPPGDALLGGFGIWRRAAGVHDPITARAVALRRGPLTVVIVAADLIGLHTQHVADVRARLAGHAPGEAVLVAATHTHSGPDTMGLWGVPPFVSGIDADYLERALAGIARAGRAAVADLGPARVRWARGQAPERGISRNRRDPELIDRTVTTLAIDRADGSPVATVVHFACHPETLGGDNDLVSADFPFYLRAALEAARPGGVGVFLNGPLGGMVTTDEDTETFAEAERIGEGIARVALTALEEDARAFPSEVDAAVSRQPLRAPIQNRSYHLANLFGVFGDRPFTSGGYTRSEVQAVRVGPAVLLTAPGEVLPRVGFELAALTEREPFLLVGLGNDELGYLIHEEDYDRERYAYERSVSPGPLTTTLLRREAEEALRAVGAR